MAKIFITGATGFLGSRLSKTLESHGHQITGIGSQNCDLTIADSLDNYITEKYDLIYHLAAWTQAGDFCLHHPGDQWLNNQQINTNVLNWWHRQQSQAKLVCMGSSCSYPPDLPLREENYMTGLPDEGLFTYAMTKRMLYAGVNALNKQYGYDYLYFIPSTIYGPNYHTDGRQMHFIFDLVRKILRGKLNNEPVILWGNGHQKRELVFIDDFISIMDRINQVKNNDIINIGTGQEYSIRQYAQIICDQVGYNADLVEYDTSKYVGVKSKKLEIDKLRSLNPDFTFTGIDQGIKSVVDWFIDNGMD